MPSNHSLYPSINPGVPRMFSRAALSILFCSALLFTGCANFAAFQSADVQEEGETSTVVGLTYSTYTIDFGDTTEGFTVPAVLFAARHGLSEKVQLHGNLWLPLGASIGMKYQFVGSPDDDGFGLSSGLDVGYMRLAASDDDGDIAALTRIDFYVPLYLGYDVSESVSFYLVPKYIGSLYSGADSEFASTLTTALGMKLGFLYIEGSYGRDFLLESTVSHLGAAVNF